MVTVAASSSRSLVVVVVAHYTSIPASEWKKKDQRNPDRSIPEASIIYILLCVHHIVYRLSLYFSLGYMYTQGYIHTKQHKHGRAGWILKFDLSRVEEIEESRCFWVSFWLVRYAQVIFYFLSFSYFFLWRGLTTSVWPWPVSVPLEIIGPHQESIKLETIYQGNSKRVDEANNIR